MLLKEKRNARVVAVMKTEFPFIQIPDEFAQVMGEPDEGTRIFRREGSHHEMHIWFQSLVRHIGFCVSPGGAAVHAGVTRAGVYRRLKAGRLTAFCFHLTGKKKTLFGGEKKLKEHAIVYVPVAECTAWQKELEDRVAKINAAKKMTDEDKESIGEAYPGEVNPDGNFLLYDPKDKGKKGMRYLNRPWDERLPEPPRKKDDEDDYEEEDAK